MKIKSALIALAAVTMLSPAASALSCMRPDIAQTMESAKAADEVYYILVGTFTSAPVPKTLKSNDPNAPQNGIGSHTAEAWFDGKILSNDARYDNPVTRLPVDVAVSCAGPWCGSVPANGREVIAFVKVRTGQPMLLEAGACPDKVHMADKVKISKLRDCFDKECQSAVDPRFDRR